MTMFPQDSSGAPCLNEALLALTTAGDPLGGLPLLEDLTFEEVLRPSPLIRL
jgi:hypothetical protein